MSGPASADLYTHNPQRGLRTSSGSTPTHSKSFYCEGAEEEDEAPPSRLSRCNQGLRADLGPAAGECSQVPTLEMVSGVLKSFPPCILKPQGPGPASDTVYALMPSDPADAPG